MKYGSTQLLLTLLKYGGQAPRLKGPRQEVEVKSKGKSLLMCTAKFITLSLIASTTIAKFILNDQITRVYGI